MTTRYLTISGQDYRSLRKVNLHFITEQLAKRGRAAFLSIGFSRLSMYKADPRRSLAALANTVAEDRGVNCYMPQTLWHPFNLKLRLLWPLEWLMFSLYKAYMSRQLRGWLVDADVILIESGMGVILVDAIKKYNPAARLIYIVSDDLKTINCSDYLIAELERIATRFDVVCVPSKKLIGSLPAACRITYVPHGIDPAIRDHADPSPYGDGLNAVSVGSMLFDPGFFEMAAKAYPQITFHVIGAGVSQEQFSLPNIKVYPEMKYESTLPYVKHANFGIAPYRDAHIPEYLVDTSVKLLQYGFFGLPAVCPDFAAGDHAGRIAYRPGNEESIRGAVAAALQMGRLQSFEWLDWAQVTDRILNPVFV